ncbi:unnamed protein product [Hymenolepis diminuta]|uniref:Uncharacterized protein n=1 Tax=Hymenolepis diminuta TaxID=6216 RepID=A0A564XZE9_HYMDI|nr:unnamed protein product [Hymenolepis diminuta]
MLPIGILILIPAQKLMKSRSLRGTLRSILGRSRQKNTLPEEKKASVKDQSLLRLMMNAFSPLRILINPAEMLPISQEGEQGVIIVVTKIVWCIVDHINQNVVQVGLTPVSFHVSRSSSSPMHPYLDIVQHP